jgi:hypothetical protein
MSGIGGIKHIPSHSCDEALGLSMELVACRLQSVVKMRGLSPQLGLEPATHKSETL